MPRFTSLRLALVNAIGFSATTIMPLWLGRIGEAFALPPWFVGLAVLALVGGAAILNLLTPVLFAAVRPLMLARVALCFAAAGQMLCVAGGVAGFVAGCAIGGAALGVLLNVTNRMMGSVDHVQHGYATFVLVEVCFATILFLGCSELMAEAGPLSVFPVLAVVALCGIPLLGDLPSSLAPKIGPRLAEKSPVPPAAMLGLLSLALFFVGQGTLNAYMPSIGRAIGLDAADAGRTIGLGMPFGLLGAVLARALGERVAPAAAILPVVVVLAVVGPALTMTQAYPVFVFAVAALAASTMFCVPYFFAILSGHDPHGRFTALGPAMMLTGVGLGPTAAVLLDAAAGLPAVGAFSAALLLLAGIAFVAAVSRGRASFLRRNRRPA